MSMPSSSGDQRFQLAGLQPLLGVEAVLPREAAVMGGHDRRVEPFGKMACKPLGQPPRIDEDQGRAVFAHECSQPVVDLGPDLGRHHGRQR